MQLARCGVVITDLKNPVMALYRSELQISVGLAETPAAVRGKKVGR